jgi:hypothetical protein
MVHALVLVLIEYFARSVGVQRFLAIDHIFPGTSASLLLIVLVVAVVALSNLTFAYVEIPGSKAVIGLLSRASAGSVATAERGALGQ